MCVCERVCAHICAYLSAGTHRGQKGCWNLWPWSTGACEPYNVVAEDHLLSGALQEQDILLTPEPSLQPPENEIFIAVWYIHILGDRIGTGSWIGAD